MTVFNSGQLPVYLMAGYIMTIFNSVKVHLMFNSRKVHWTAGYIMAVFNSRLL